MGIDFYFDKSRGDMRYELQKELDNCSSLRVVSGFVTEAGLSDLGNRNILVDKLQLIIFGHSNNKALFAMTNLYEKLQRKGKNDIIKIHLGYGHFPTESNGINSVFRPMMHTKIFLYEYNDNTYKAYVGSQNITGYSIRGLNSEALIKITGTIGDQLYQKINSQILALEIEAKYFDPRYLQIYEDWHWNIVNGLVPIKSEKRVYFSILYTFIDRNESNPPKKGDRLYFEVPLVYNENLTSIDNNYADIWIIPTDPNDITWKPDPKDIFFFRATQMGANDTKGQPTEWKDVQWHIPNYRSPMMKRLDSNTKYNGGEVQVYMEFEKSFDEVYPGSEYEDISYYPILRRERMLTPLFSDEGEFGLRKNANEPQRPGKDYEVLEEETWVLIKKFKQMDEIDTISEIRRDKILKPINIISNKDMMQNGIIYKQRVREIHGESDFNNP